MNQSQNSDDLDSSEDERPSVSSLLRHFETFNRSELPKLTPVNQFIVSSSSDSEQEDNVERSIFHNNDSDTINNTVACEHAEIPCNVDDSEKPAVPQRTNLHGLPPTPALRKLNFTNAGRSITVKNPSINMEKGRNLMDQTPPLPPKIREMHSELRQDFEDAHRTNNISPVPRTRDKIHPAMDKTTSGLNLGRGQPDGFLEASGVPPRPLRRSGDVPTRSSAAVTRDSLNNQRVRNNVMASKRDTHDINGSAINALPLKQPVRPQRANNPAENTLSSNRKDHQIPVNFGATKRTPFASTITQDKTSQNILNVEENIANNMIPPKHVPNKLANSSLQEPIYVNLPLDQPKVPPLPPKSLAVRRMVSSIGSSSSQSSSIEDNFNRNSSGLGAVEKLNDLKAIFTSTNASKSDKYNKSILLLIDIMVEAIQESSSNVEKRENEMEDSAWYSTMKDFVHSHTKDYIKENQISNNYSNISYDKLLNTMVPKFIETYVDTDIELNQNNHSGEEDNYDKVDTKLKKHSDNQELQSEDIREKIFEIINEINQTEANHVSNLESYIEEYCEQTHFSYKTPILEKLWSMQCEFKNILEGNDDDVIWILKTFLDFDDFKYPTDLSVLLLNRLRIYMLYIKKITRLLKVGGETRKAAENVMEVLNEAMEKCINADAVGSQASTPSNDGSESMIFDGQGGTMVLENLIPTSENWHDSRPFLLKNKFKIDSHKTDYTVFLFGQVIVIKEEVSKDNLEYHSSLNLNELVLLPQGRNKKTLKLKHYQKSKFYNKDIVIKFKAKSKEIEKCWRRQINECLWAQLRKQKKESTVHLNNISL